MPFIACKNCHQSSIPLWFPEQRAEQMILLPPTLTKLSKSTSMAYFFPGTEILSGFGKRLCVTSAVIQAASLIGIGRYGAMTLQQVLSSTAAARLFLVTACTTLVKALTLSEGEQLSRTEQEEGASRAVPSSTKPLISAPSPSTSSSPASPPTGQPIIRTVSLAISTTTSPHGTETKPPSMSS